MTINRHLLKYIFILHRNEINSPYLKYESQYILNLFIKFNIKYAFFIQKHNKYASEIWKFTDVWTTNKSISAFKTGGGKKADTTKNLNDFSSENAHKKVWQKCKKSLFHPKKPPLF